jgi:RNA polymerase sigma-70 factor (ECF subfamily)
VTDGGVDPDGASAHTPSSLLVRVKAQDPEAWKRFVQLYGPLIYRWCRRAGLQEADAADVGQEVFRAAAGALPDYHHDQKGDSFRGWLWTITRRKVLDFVGRKPPGAQGVGGSDAQTALQELAGPREADSDDDSAEADRLLLCRRAVELVLADCKQETRQAFLRVVAGGQRPAEVARDLGLTVNAVYLAKSHLLRRIREEFAGLVDV